MSEFDDLDLGRRLRDAAGSDPDVTEARHAVARRVVRARRRRVAVVSSAATVLVVAIGVVATIDNDADRRVQSASPATDSVTQTTPDSSTASTDASSTTILGTTTDPRGPATTVPTPTTLPSTLPGSPPPSAVSTTTFPGEVPVESTTTEATSPTSTEPATTAPPADATNTYPSVGGTITVRLSGGQLQLLSVNITDGYVIDKQVEKPDDVELRFVAGDAESRIRVRIVDGQMNAETVEN